MGYARSSGNPFDEETTVRVCLPSGKRYLLLISLKYQVHQSSNIKASSGAFLRRWFFSLHPSGKHQCLHSNSQQLSSLVPIDWTSRIHAFFHPSIHCAPGLSQSFPTTPLIQHLTLKKTRMNSLCPSNLRSSAEVVGYHSAAQLAYSSLIHSMILDHGILQHTQQCVVLLNVPSNEQGTQQWSLVMSE